MNQRLKNRFGMVSNSVMRNPEISLRAKGLYAYLCTYANENNELTVGINKMCSECGLTRSTIKRTLEELKAKNIIYREKRELGKSFKTKLI